MAVGHIADDAIDTHRRGGLNDDDPIGDQVPKFERTLQSVGGFMLCEAPDTLPANALSSLIFGVRDRGSRIWWSNCGLVHFCRSPIDRYRNNRVFRIITKYIMLE